jgi:hypothetical protein
MMPLEDEEKVMAARPNENLPALLVSNQPISQEQEFAEVRVPCRAPLVPLHSHGGGGRT